MLEMAAKNEDADSTTEGQADHSVQQDWHQSDRQAAVRWSYQRRFDNPVTVGYMYYLKLHHLVDDKIHARSTGPYSAWLRSSRSAARRSSAASASAKWKSGRWKRTAQAHMLQEILTVKSDDTIGRVKTYEAIVKGKNIPNPGVPESFKVLLKELQALALDVQRAGRGSERDRDSRSWRTISTQTTASSRTSSFRRLRRMLWSTKRISSPRRRSSTSTI